MIFLLAAPAAVGTPVSGDTDVDRQATRDTVIGGPQGAAAAAISAGAATARYPIGDGSGATIAVAVTPACQATCTDADPQRIADLVGTFLHGPEVTLLTVQLSAPHQIAYDCGFGAQACYYPRQNRIFLNGNDVPTPDGAGRDYVLAHEYGHHVAYHRRTPGPFPPALDWGTAHWSSQAGICRRHRARQVFPGVSALRYFRHPGEAFAEAFARYHFPDSGVKWRWLPALEPGPAAFRAIRRDTLEPWDGGTGFVLSGRVPRRGQGATTTIVRTPLDGRISIRPTGLRRHRYLLSLSNGAGRVLRTSTAGLGPRRKLDFTVCGQRRLRIKLRSTTRTGGAFRLLVRRP